MERIGERLRRRREELGFTIEDIARATRYRPDTIRAVEEGRVGVFPAEAYRQAFLRAYAERLNLDAGEIVRDQKSEEERVQEALKGIRIGPSKGFGFRRPLIWALIVVGVAVALLVLYDRVIKGGNIPPSSGEVRHAGTAPAESPLATPADTLPREPGPESGVPSPAEEEHPERDSGGVVQPEGRDEEAGPGSGLAATPVEAPAREDRSLAGGDQGNDAGQCLDVSVGGYAVRMKLFAGDSLLVNQWLHRGYKHTFCARGSFRADTIIVQPGATLRLVLDGNTVPLPDTRDNLITGFRISP
jgi:cytoskeleton protein RodZ